MKQPSIRANWLFNLVNKLIGYMTPLIVAPYVSRIFGADGIGINSYVTANVTYFNLFCMLGIDGYGRRIIAISRDDKEETSKVFWELVILHSITSLVVILLYCILIISSDKYRIYYAINLITILASVIDFNWFFEAYEQFKFISVRNCIIKILILVCTFFLIHTKEDLALYVGINAMSIFLSNFSILIPIRKYIKAVPLKNLNWIRHMKEVWVYFLPTIAASVYSILDKSVINWITKSEKENGYYEQAYKLLMVVNTFVHSLETVTAPRMSNLFINGTEEEFKRRLNSSVQMMFLIGMACSFGLAAIAPNLVPLFFGTGFDKVIPIIYIFMPLVIVLGISVYLDGLYLVPSGQRGKSAIANCVGAVLNFVLNIILVIKWQSIGAAIATLVTESVICAIISYLSKKLIDWRLIIRSMIIYMIYGAIMFGIVREISNLNLQGIKLLIVQVIAGICVYIGLLLLGKDAFVLDAVVKRVRK